MTTRRAILLQALDDWRAEGALDESTWRFLRSRYENAPAGELDAPLGEGAPAAAAAAVEDERRGGFAFDAMQLIGGLLLGAAAIALVLYLDVAEQSIPWVLAGLAAVGVGLGAALHFLAREARPGLVEAALAAGLVPAAVAGGYALGTGPAIAGLVPVALAIGAHALRGGRGPSAVVAAAAFSLGSAAVIVRDIDSDPGTLQVLTWFLAVAGYLAFTLVWRHHTWSAVASGAMVIPLVIAFLAVLAVAFDDLQSEVVELLVGALLGAVVAIGVWLGARPLVAAGAAGLTIDAVVFAFDLGGFLTALLVLLALGGLLVWQAHFLRRYFGRRGHQQRL